MWLAAVTRAAATPVEEGRMVCRGLRRTVPREPRLGATDVNGVVRPETTVTDQSGTGVHVRTTTDALHAALGIYGSEG